MDRMRWGIVSTGRMADWFCSDFEWVPNGQLTGVCSRQLATAQSFAARHQIPHCFQSLDAMISSGQVDIVYIATPHTTHKSLIMTALNAGMPVLCEKPAVTSVADMIDVISCAKDTQTYFAEAMWTWHLPAIQTAKAWVESGRIGRVAHVKADFGYPIPYSENQREYDAHDAGGALREMGIYPIAIARRFLHGEPVQISVAHQTAPNGVEDDLVALFDFGDATASLATSLKYRLGNGADIIGENGHIRLPDAFRAARAELYEVDTLIDSFTEIRHGRGYAHMAIATADDVKAGLKESPVVTHAASLAFQTDIKRLLDLTGRGEGV